MEWIICEVALSVGLHKVGSTETRHLSPYVLESVYIFESNFVAYIMK